MASESDRDDAQRTLDQLTQVRASMTARVVAPWWYRWGMALSTALIFVGIGLFPTESGDTSTLSSLLVVAGAIVGPAALTTALKRTTGVAVNRYAQGMFLWYLVVFGLLAVGFAVQVWLQVPYALLAGAPVAFVATLVLERHLDRIMVQRLGTGSAG